MSFALGDKFKRGIQLGAVRERIKNPKMLCTFITFYYTCILADRDYYHLKNCLTNNFQIEHCCRKFYLAEIFYGKYHLAQIFVS